MRNVRDRWPTKEKRNPLLDQVRHTGLTHFKPNPTVKDDRADAAARVCVNDGDDDDEDGGDDGDDADNPTISDRLKAISDKYLKSSTHRFLAKFYRNGSAAKTDKPITGTDGRNVNENNINKVSMRRRQSVFVYLEYYCCSGDHRVCTFVFATRRTENGEGGSIFPSRTREIREHFFSVYSIVSRRISERFSIQVHPFWYRYGLDVCYF